MSYLHGKFVWFEYLSADQDRAARFHEQLFGWRTQVMAMGEALTEELIYDPVRGIPLNFNFIDYKMPTILDMPDIEPVLLEVWRGAGEYGACGIGEGTLTCTPRAIANAMYNAIGARVDELPLTPEKVLRALGKI